MRTQSLGFQKPFANQRIAKRGQMVLLLLAALGWWAGSASAAILNVGSCVTGGYPTIGAAVAAAAAGDTVSVCPGTYAEIVTIEKNLTLVGKTPSPGSFATLEFPSSGVQCGVKNTCPQIIVENAKAQIERLHIDGSGFPFDCNYTPIGIFFENASGSAAYNTIQNEISKCGSPRLSPRGDGIFAISSNSGNYSVQAIGNYIDNFADYGFSTSAVASKAVNNMIGEEIGQNWGIYFASNEGSSALNNTMWGTGTAANQVGIEVDDSPNTSLVRNSISNIATGIAMAERSQGGVSGNSTLIANILTDVSEGIDLFCSDNNALASNRVSDQPAAGGEDGVNIFACGPSQGSDNNWLIGNSFNGLCAGILTGTAANTGNVLIINTFTNIGPGADVMPGNTCM
jgi:parallel beta-helix repeat protein